jgi:hypothetical protein
LEFSEKSRIYFRIYYPLKDPEMSVSDCRCITIY